MEFLFFDTRFIFEQEVAKRQVPILVIMSQNRLLTIPDGFRQFDIICHERERTLSHKVFRREGDGGFYKCFKKISYPRRL